MSCSKLDILISLVAGVVEPMILDTKEARLAQIKDRAGKIAKLGGLVLLISWPLVRNSKYARIAVPVFAVLSETIGVLLSPAKTEEEEINSMIAGLSAISKETLINLKAERLANNSSLFGNKDTSKLEA